MPRGRAGFFYSPFPALLFTGRAPTKHTPGPREPGGRKGRIAKSDKGTAAGCSHTSTRWWIPDESVPRLRHTREDAV
jgi:hypothetical protein